MTVTTLHTESTKKGRYALRAIDTVDRTQARAAMRIHDARNVVRDTLLKTLDVVEERFVAGIARMREALETVDATSADVVNRAQGVVNQALEVARERGTKHLPS